MNDSHYSPLRASEEDSSPQEHLLPVSQNDRTLHRFPSTYSVILNPVVTLRILSSILGLTSFIILVIDGDEEFIASDIFLMFALIVNALMIIHHFASNVFKVTVELRQKTWRAELDSRRKTKVSTYFDVGLAGIIFICLIIGHGIKRWGGVWKAGVIIGYFVVILQSMCAVPNLDRKNLILSARLSDWTGKVPLDTKDSVVPDDTQRSPARRWNADPEEAQTAEQLV